MILDLSSEIYDFHSSIAEEGYEPNDVTEITENLVDDIDALIAVALDEFYRINVFTGVQYEEVSKKIYEEFDTTTVFLAANTPFPMVKQINDPDDVRFGFTRDVPDFDRDLIVSDEDNEDEDGRDNLPQRSVSMADAIKTEVKRTKSRAAIRRRNLVRERVYNIREGVRRIGMTVGKQTDQSVGTTRIVSELEGFLSSEIDELIGLYEDLYIE